MEVVAKKKRNHVRSGGKKWEARVAPGLLRRRYYWTGIWAEAL
jgi:hypothetical protein